MIREWLIIGKNRLDENKFMPVKNDMFVKPIGGLWASPYIPHGKYKSAWHEFTLEECNMYKNPNEAIKLELKEDARIYTIDTQEDLINLADKYGFVNSFSLSHSLDFENIAKHFDGIYLTERGQWETRLPLENNKYNLYGWDVPSILIMNFFSISKWEYIDIDSKREI